MKAKEKMVKIKTKFTGYISGDCECFVLSKKPYEEWLKRLTVNRDLEEGLLYPDDFFKGLDKEKKYNFKITVEAEEA